jgi:hypothetical protein
VADAGFLTQSGPLVYDDTHVAFSSLILPAVSFRGTVGCKPGFPGSAGFGSALNSNHTSFRPGEITGSLPGTKS